MNSVPKNCTKLKTVTDNSASNSSISQPSVSSSVAGDTRMCKLDTLNLEFFARILLSRNLANAKFCENKIPHKMAKPIGRLLM